MQKEQSVRSADIQDAPNAQFLSCDYCLCHYQPLLGRGRIIITVVNAIMDQKYGPLKLSVWIAIMRLAHIASRHKYSNHRGDCWNIYLPGFLRQLKGVSISWFQATHSQLHFDIHFIAVKFTYNYGKYLMSPNRAMNLLHLEMRECSPKAKPTVTAVKQKTETQYFHQGTSGDTWFILNAP